MQVDRLKKFQEICKKHNIDALLLSNVDTIFYLTGWSGFSSTEREGYALVTGKMIYIFTDARLINAVPTTEFLKPIEISAKNPFREILTAFCKTHNVKRLGFEPHDLTAAEFIAFRKLKAFTLVPTDLSTLRERKDSKEIEMIHEACKLTDNAFDYILGIIKPGLTEKEIASEIEIFFKGNMADISFPSIVAFGEHSTIPHHSPTDKKLSQQEIIKLDFGCRLNHYCSDMTRTIFVGKPTDEQRKVYEVVQRAQEKAFEYLYKKAREGTGLSEVKEVASLRNGKHVTEASFEDEERQDPDLNLNKQDSVQAKVTTADVDRVAREYIISQGYPSIPHSLGHGIGLEVHEKPSLSPSSQEILENGMVFSIEPGIYLSGKFGVRIEDIVVRTKNGINLLTNSSRELIVL